MTEEHEKTFVPLVQKYRPTNFDEVIGQESAVKSLKALFERDKGALPHGFFFYGPYGVGKSTLGFIIRKLLECHDQDFIFYDAAKLSTKDAIIEAVSRCNFRPLGGPTKVYLIDECHNMSKKAQETLLTSVEHPPSHAYFIFCTTEPEKMIPTIRSRCMEFKLRHVDRRKLFTYLQELCKKEGVDDYPEKVLKQIAHCAEGSVRNAVKMLDQVIDIEDDDEAFEAVAEASLGSSEVKELCQLLMSSGTRWDQIAKVFKGIDEEPEKIRYALLGYFGAVLLNKGDQRICDMITVLSEPCMYSGRGGLTGLLYLAHKA